MLFTTGYRGRSCRGRSETCPYVGVYKNYNEMDVIRHDDKCIQNHVFIMVNQILPARCDDTAVIIQNHLAILNLSQNRLTTLHTNRYKIGTFTAVIVSFQAD